MRIEIIEYKVHIKPGKDVAWIDLPYGTKMFKIHAVWFYTLPDTVLSFFEIYDVDPRYSEFTNLIYKVENESKWYEPLPTPVTGIPKYGKIFFKVPSGLTCDTYVRIITELWVE